MRAFAQLFVALDRTSRTSEKLAALERYFRSVPPADAAWALWFLAGERLKRAVKTAHLRQWVAEAAHLPLWLVEECYEHVGDLGETLALLLPPNANPSTLPLAQLVEQRLLPLARAAVADQRALLRATWAELDHPQRLVWHKLITGNFRVGVARALVVRALAAIARVEVPVMAHRLMGGWQPRGEDFRRLLAGEALGDAAARPYPFFLASPLEAGPGALGEVADWQVEWKWDGIRAQLLRRAGQTVIWSRGDEIITAGFPEVAQAAGALADGTVLDGELLAWREAAPLPFAQLQRRLNRRHPTAALRHDVPVGFMAYDLLEHDGTDWRGRPLWDRRRQLEQIVGLAEARIITRQVQLVRGAQWVQVDWLAEAGPPRAPAVPLRLSPILPVRAWEDTKGLMSQARLRGAEGLMLKRRDSLYGTGRHRGAWWKWKVAPLTCDAVLVAAQPGHGRRATLFTDYTLAVWQGEELVPVAKAYAGLTDKEIDAVDAFVRAHTTGRFGPVRAVKPDLVFELAFEGLAPSARHKAGFALRFPRIARQRHDKKPAEADTVETLRELARQAGAA
jgi:DNA ligase-1